MEIGSNFVILSHFLSKEVFLRSPLLINPLFVIFFVFQLCRFHKIAWSDHDMSSGARTSGYIIGGTDNGEICIYDPVAILEGKKEEALLHTLKEHTGPVQAIDINNFQSNLFASGSCNSELLIWDLKNLTSGLVPGPVTNPPDQITCIKWNNQVQHILAASSRASRVVVWDLRKSEPIIKVGDQSAMVCTIILKC